MIRRPPRSTLSLPDALPISVGAQRQRAVRLDYAVVIRHGIGGAGRIDSRHGIGDLAGATYAVADDYGVVQRSEEHTSELQSPCNVVCRLLLEKQKITVACPA